MTAGIADDKTGGAPVYKLRVTVECMVDEDVLHSHADHVIFTDPARAVLDTAWKFAHHIVDVARQKSEVPHV